ncbi:hypothetical protein JW905_14690, partial [bacterium]|nr:hypothetical protein [candidate division CSSED10-310 bacterium]
MKALAAGGGMFHYLVNSVRPDLAEAIRTEGRAETAIIGLGGQGTKHAGLMLKYGTPVVAGIAPGKGGTRVEEIIPAYNSVAECLEAHPHVAAVSIWRHYSTAREATLEAIDAGIPIVILITEGIPLRDIRDILVAARQHRTVLLGGNTPGVIFPPEAIKIGMLPDIFHPQELVGEYGPRGVTILSRSGAILYHLSDALASIGVAQNAVLGVGGDAAIGSTFMDLVPLVMGYEHTDLVVVAGEIGGCMEELLARDIQAHPEKYPKPLVTLISGANAPAGKTMGHAGAIVTPGQQYGTFITKKQALEAAGVPVANSQYDLIDFVKDRLGGRTYFPVESYYKKMSRVWDEPPAKASWGTIITKVQPNRLLISGYPLQQLIERCNLLESVHLLIQGELPAPEQVFRYQRIAADAAGRKAPAIPDSSDDLSKKLATCLLLDRHLASVDFKGRFARVEQTVFCLGRIARFLAAIMNRQSVLDGLGESIGFDELIFRVATGERTVDSGRARLLEAMVV